MPYKLVSCGLPNSLGGLSHTWTNCAKESCSNASPTHPTAYSMQWSLFFDAHQSTNFCYYEGQMAPVRVQLLRWCKIAENFFDLLPRQPQLTHMNFLPQSLVRVQVCQLLHRIARVHTNQWCFVSWNRILSLFTRCAGAAPLQVSRIFLVASPEFWRWHPWVFHAVGAVSPFCDWG